MMPPYPAWSRGREAVLAAYRASWDPASPHYVGRFRLRETRANAHPATAVYLKAPGATVYRATAISVLRVEDDLITAIDAFHDPSLFAAFGLPAEHR